MRYSETTSLASAVLSVAFSAAFFCASAGAAPVYLKNGATGACDGTSWTDAYTNVVVAIRAAEAGDGLLYVARGVYVFTNVISVTSPLAIYGGFAGESMDETPATRDTAANQTVFSGDVGGDDYWTHYEPNASGFGVTSSALKSNKIIGPDGVNLPPDFTGDYDGYSPNSGATVNSHRALSFGANATAVLDGLTFACFINRNGATGVTVYIPSPGSVVNDCTFIANTCSATLYFSVDPKTFPNGVQPTATNCRFLYNWGYGSTSFGAGLNAYYGPVTVSNCTFLCVSKTYGARGNVLYAGTTGGLRVRNCEFARCLMASGTSNDNRWGGSGNIFAGEGGSNTAFSDCVVSNCYTATSHATPIALLSSGNAGNLILERCLFANNKSVVNASEGKCHAMIDNPQSTGRKNFSYESCTFSSNVVAAAKVSAESGSYVLSLIGNYSVRVDASLLNCTFDGNRCETVETEGVTPIFCRGVASASYSAAANGMGFANCAFYGPADGTYDIVQYGSTHTEPVNVVNCVFTADGEEQPDPVYADVPALIRFYSCSIQNRLQETGGFTYDGLQPDKVPLARETVGDGPLYALAAAAATPGIRSTCDVATNSVTGTALSSWNFRLPGSETWQALSPATAALSGSGFDAKLVGDALGSARPAGAFTRGPVQALVEPAETGATLVLRRDPFGAGTFSGEAVQAVVAGAAPAPVTVSANDPNTYSFDGWYDENGALYSSSATLSIPSLAAGTTVLTARLEAQVAVNLTFSLDGHGTFNSTGTDTATVEAEAFAAFPAVPSFTVDDGWFFAGFTLPATVPETDTAYTARIVTKDVRVVRVVPAAEAPAVQDGLTWETAYADLAAAYADAATYRGEVWLKEGRYLVRTPVQMLPNVAVRGGFAGTETDAAEADPEAHPAILSGDINANGYWYGNNSSSLNHGAIWTGTTFNSPNPSASEWCWAPHGNNSDDALTAFLCTDGVATNCVFDGLTFTGFFSSALVATSGETGGLVVSRCRFLATTTSCGNTSSTPTVNLSGAPATFTNCLFNGSWHGIRLAGSPAEPTVIADCVFTNVSGTYYAGCVYTAGAHAADIRRCGFYRNGCDSRSGPASAISFESSSSASHVVSDSVFAANFSIDTCHGAVAIRGGSAMLARCRFAGNRLSHYATTVERTFAACVAATSGTLVLRDCHISGSTASDASDNTFPIASVAATSGSGVIVLANCTVETNAVTVNSSSRGATFAVENSSAAYGIVLANTLVDASSFSGETVSGEFLCTSASGNLALVNAVVRNEGAGYTPFSFVSDSFQPTIASSVISGYDPDAIPAPGANGYLYDVVSATASVGPLREGENGALARGVSGPAFAKLGRPVWLVGTTPYIYDDVANPAKPWRSLLSRSSYAASVSGLDTGTPPLPDAFGAPRKPRYCAPGPLNGAPIQTMIMVK